MLLGALGTSLLGNLLTSIGVMRADEGTVRGGEGTIRAGKYRICGKFVVNIENLKAENIIHVLKIISSFYYLQ